MTKCKKWWLTEMFMGVGKLQVGSIRNGQARGSSHFFLHNDLLPNVLIFG